MPLLYFKWIEYTRIKLCRREIASNHEQFDGSISIFKFLFNNYCYVRLLFHAISSTIVIFFQYTRSIMPTTNGNKCSHIQSVK